MIGTDLDKSESPNGFAVRSNVMITLHANFDPEYGYPQSYYRKASGRTPLQSKWTVQKFRRVSKEDEAAEKTKNLRRTPNVGGPPGTA